MTSSELPSGTAYAAEAALRPRRRRPFTFARLLHGAAPYLLILPVVAVIVAILGYPLYHLARLSFQKYGLFELIAHHGTSVGWANYSSILHDHVFWDVLLRTIVFTIANVALTIGIGTLLALLLTKVSSVVRILLTAGLVLAWAMPPVVAVQVWVWMTNTENGVLNYALTKLQVGDYSQHDWYATLVLPALADDLAGRLGRDPVRRGDGLRGARAGARTSSSRRRRSTARGLGACSET